MAAIRERVLAGEQVLGAMIFEFFSPGIPQLLVHAGCEYALYDMEHTGVGLETMKAQVSYCRGLPITPMVRVPRGEYQFLARALDIGMRGVMIPMVESREEAEAIAGACRYPPMGRRGAAFGFAHDDFIADPAATIAKANAETLVIAQIETERGLENVDEIASTTGIDVLWVGHFDLANFLGIPGEFQNPVFIDAVKATVAAARRHGKGLGFMPADAAWAAEYKGYGFNMLAVGTDHGLLMQGVKSVLASVEEA
ncbi:MAG: aldolase/citrate lyase family protein [Pseudomonadota bacterium]